MFSAKYIFFINKYNSTLCILRFSFHCKIVRVLSMYSFTGCSRPLVNSVTSHVLGSMLMLTTWKALISLFRKVILTRHMLNELLIVLDPESQPSKCFLVLLFLTYPSLKLSSRYHNVSPSIIKASLTSLACPRYKQFKPNLTLL